MKVGVMWLLPGAFATPALECGECPHTSGRGPQAVDRELAPAKPCLGPRENILYIVPRSVAVGVLVGGLVLAV